MNKKVLGLILLVAGLSFAAQAVDVFRAANPTLLDVSGAFTNAAGANTIPGAGDVAVWDKSLTVANSSIALAADGSWQGIRFGSGMVRGVTIATNGVTQTTLTLGSSGIDLASSPYNLIINPNVVLGSAQTWALAPSGSTTTNAMTVHGAVSGGVGSGLTKTGAGILTLNGANTYQGTTTISGGTLQIGNGGNSGTLGSGAVINNGALVFSRTNALSVANDISGTGSVVNNNTGNLTFTGANTATGDFGWTASGKGNITTASIGNGNGKIRIFQNEALHTTASITTTKGLVFGGGTQINQDLYVDSGTLTIGGLVTDNAAVTTSIYRKLGVGTLVYTNNANTFATKTQISEGGLSVSSIKNVGVASALGQPGTAAQGTLNIGAGVNTGTLIYTGTGDTSDRILNLFGTSGGMTLDQSGAGLLKFTSDLTAASAGAKTLTLQGSTAGAGELGGAIVDSSGGATALTKTGSGTWTLSGNNTFTGAAAVNGGTLSLNRAGGTLADTVAVTINSGATLDVAQDDTVGAVQVQVNGGTISGAGTLTGSSFTANTASGKDAAISAKLAGATATFVKLGVGSATLSGANTFGGGTTASAGTLGLGHKDALGTGNLTLSGAQLNIAADLTGGVANTITLAGATNTINATDNIGAVVNSAVFSGVIGNDGTARNLTLTTVNKGASAATRSVLTLSAANTYGGDTIIKKVGTSYLTVKNGIDDALSTTGVLRCNPDTVGQVGLYYNLNGFNQTLAGITGNGPLGIQNTGTSILTINTANGTDYLYGGQNQNLSGGTTLVKTGDGIQRLGYDGSSGAITHSGGTKILGGTLVVWGGSGIGSGDLDITNGTLQIATSANGYGLNLAAAINGNSAASIDLNGSTLTQTGTSITGDFGGSIINAGSYVKAGAGTQTLSGTNTYSGNTTVSMGKLLINGDNSGATGAVTVNAGAILGGSGKIGGVTTVQSGGTLSAGNSPGTLTFDGALTLSTGSTNVMEITAIAYDILMGNGLNTLTLDGLTVFDFSGFAGGVTNGYTIALSSMFSNWSSVVTTGTTYSAVGLSGSQSLDFTGGNLTVIPEPATIGMLGLGAIITMMIRRVRTR